LSYFRKIDGILF